jgi:hypothetical protein
MSRPSVRQSPEADWGLLWPKRVAPAEPRDETPPHVGAFDLAGNKHSVPSDRAWRGGGRPGDAPSRDPACDRTRSRLAAPPGAASPKRRTAVTRWARPHRRCPQQCPGMAHVDVHALTATLTTPVPVATMMFLRTARARPGRAAVGGRIPGSGWTRPIEPRLPVYVVTVWPGPNSRLIRAGTADGKSAMTRRQAIRARYSAGTARLWMLPVHPSRSPCRRPAASATCSADGKE